MKNSELRILSVGNQLGMEVRLLGYGKKGETSNEE